MKLHELKTDALVFQAVKNGYKTFEIRKNDREYQTGDLLLLNETLYTGAEMAEGKSLYYTGQKCLVKVTHVLHGPVYGLQDGWCIMSFKILDRN